jgi:hypothetical protein
VGSETSPLPITLVKFTGERATDSQGALNEEVNLAWQTASEINNKGFEVEMSENGRDYTKIAFVEGKGNSTTVKSYELRVHNADDTYYRLKQIDFDGKFAYSPVVFVEGIETLKVYPNPNKGTFTVAIQKSANTPARLYNLQGMEVWKDKLPTEKTELMLNLPTGLYFLQIVERGKNKVVKIIIE